MFRFGEENAQGWVSWMEDQPKTTHNIPLGEIFPNSNIHDKDSTQDDIMNSRLEKTAIWLKVETSRETEQWCPRKTSDDEDENEDPDRIVLFQDISFVLFKISDEKLKFQLLCYFLSFLGVCVDLEKLFPVFQDEKQLTSFVDNDVRQRLVFGWNCLENPGNTQQTPGMTHCMFVRNIFNQSLQCFPEHLHTLWAIHWLDFEKNILVSENNPKYRKQYYKAARKLAKSLLKLEQHRNDLSLWFAFIQIEWIYGNINEARQVVCSLLEQLQNSSDETSIMRYYNFVRYQRLSKEQSAPGNCNL